MKPIRYKLTSSESNSFNAFAEERVMAFKSITPKVKMTRDQEDHLRSCFFNGISDAYAAGMATENRKKRPDAVGSRQILDEISWLLEKDHVKNKKYLRSIADRLSILAKQYARCKKAVKK